MGQSQFYLSKFNGHSVQCHNYEPVMKIVITLGYSWMLDKTNLPSPDKMCALQSLCVKCAWEILFQWQHWTFDIRDANFINKPIRPMLSKSCHISLCTHVA